MVNRNKIYLEQPNLQNAEREENYFGGSSSACSEEASNYPEHHKLVRKVKTTFKHRTRNAPKRYHQVARKPSLWKNKGESEVDKKMGILRQLIPNCPNVGNAGVLDEAIAYIKILQNQIQFIWSSTNAFTAGMYSSSMLSLPRPNMMHQFHASSFPGLVGSRTEMPTSGTFIQQPTQISNSSSCPSFSSYGSECLFPQRNWQ